MITPPCINITPPRTARRKKRAMYSIINKNSFSVYRKSNRRAFCRIPPAYKIPFVLLISVQEGVLSADTNNNNPVIQPYISTWPG